MEPISPQPGSNPDPRDFVGRAATTRIARRKLLAGNNLALTDPRRMGKSFWMEHFCRTTSDFVPVIVDYEGVRTSAEFLLRTAEALGRHQGLPSAVRTTLQGFFKGLEEVTLGPVQIRVSVRDMSSTSLLAQMVLTVNEHASKTLLVCMDEVPLALRNIARNEGGEAAVEVLQTLRKLRREGRKIRWIVAGSVGFHHVLRECQATEGDLNDLDTLPLGPLEVDEASELAERLLLGIGRPAAGSESVTALLEWSGGIPFLLHKLASMLQDHATGPVTAEEVHAVFDAFVDDRDESRAVVHLLTRLDPNYGEYAGIAQQILDLTARGVEPSTPTEIAGAIHQDESDISLVVDYLLDDHYLSRHGDSVTWRYEILRRIWARRRWQRSGVG